MAEGNWKVCMWEALHRESTCLVTVCRRTWKRKLRRLTVEKERSSWYRGSMTAYWRAVGIRELTTGTDCEVAANGERGSEGSWAAGVSLRVPEWVSEVTQSCPTLCKSMDFSPPDSSVHGISQARILKWAAISFSRGSSWPRDQTRVSCITRRFFTTEPPGELGVSFTSLPKWTMQRNRGKQQNGKDSRSLQAN